MFEIKLNSGLNNDVVNQQFSIKEWNGIQWQSISASIYEFKAVEIKISSIIFWT